MADHFDEKSGVVPSKTPWGSWAQTIDEVFIEVNVPKGTKGREIICEIKPKSINFILKGKEVFKVSFVFVLIHMIRHDGQHLHLSNRKRFLCLNSLK